MEQHIEQWPAVPICYFFTPENNRCPIPIMKNHYGVTIRNNFAEITNTQIYQNPFQKPLEIHYSIPTDPGFCLTNLTVYYDNAVVEGVIKEKVKAKA